MYIEDRLYGSFSLEPVFEELISTKAVQRLKYIHQNGASFLVNPKWNNTRFDHSVGVMLLIRNLGGSIEEQLAGLLHDVSHTTFSHVVDQVLKIRDEDYHELIKDTLIQESDIPAVLSKHGYDLKVILDESNWSILEQPAPHLCADRVDYTLRDLYGYGEITKLEVKSFLNELAVIDGKMQVTTIRAGEWFVQTYYKEVLNFFLHPLNVYGNHQMANILKMALDKEIIVRDDFLKTDVDLLRLLKNSGDSEINKELNKLNQVLDVSEDTEDYSIHTRKKVRLIDPDYYDGACSTPISERSTIVKKRNEEAKEQSLQGVKIRVTYS
ncbi:HD domain-containing protein [Alkalihalobacillus sp. TS-13]|uniref:HD domain-containing protein n=1 Tax=Alkalihalobacillus sp. TS-13 TaxID=2842455 RepID=UPI001C87BC13|nr:HD domain-containing protein [Alkalihalobacillus sp. TS-13]